jgi:hypothetical protein
MSFASDMAGVATDLLNEFDERTNKILLKKNSVAVWDSEIAENVITEGATVELTGVATPYDQAMVDGNTIQTGDIKLTITNSVEPSAQDKIEVDGVEYSIVAITPFAYTGKNKTIAYAVHIRN